MLSASVCSASASPSQSRSDSSAGSALRRHFDQRAGQCMTSRSNTPGLHLLDMPLGCDESLASVCAACAAALDGHSARLFQVVVCAAKADGRDRFAQRSAVASVHDAREGLERRQTVAWGRHREALTCSLLLCAQTHSVAAQHGIKDGDVRRLIGVRQLAGPAFLACICHDALASKLRDKQDADATRQAGDEPVRERLEERCAASVHALDASSLLGAYYSCLSH